MKNQIQVSLVVVSVMFLIWGMGFIMLPETMHEILSAGPYDPATTSLFVAAMIGLSLLFLIAAQDPQRDFVYGLAATLGFFSITSAIGMLPEGGMNSNGATLLSLLVTTGIAVYLFVIQSEAVAAGFAGGSSRKKPAKKAKKKAAKKKPAKKAKKKAKKRR